MDCRPTDIPPDPLQALARLRRLPRPVLGQALSLPNQAIDRPHRHPWIQLSYAECGVITVDTAGARYLAPPSRAVWIPPGLTHAVQIAPGTRIRSLYIEADALPARACQVVDISPLLRELILAFGGLAVEYDEAGWCGYCSTSWPGRPPATWCCPGPGIPGYSPCAGNWRPSPTAPCR